MNDDMCSGFIVNVELLPEKFPTHVHDPAFWESLGRAVATFGFLEEILGKAIFAFTATRKYDIDEIQAAYDAWLPKLERAIKDPLGGLIDQYGKAARENLDVVIDDLDGLLAMLKRASELRNVLCHGSWRKPNADGKSVPLFVNKQMMVFETAVDCGYIDQVQRHASELACMVINTVTTNGWQFPGSMGPGIKIE